MYGQRTLVLTDDVFGEEESQQAEKGSGYASKRRVGTYGSKIERGDNGEVYEESQASETKRNVRMAWLSKWTWVEYDGVLSR